MNNSPHYARLNGIGFSVSWENKTPPTVAKINGFASLPKGWDYGRGVPPTAETIKEAIAIYELFTQLGFAETNAFPGDSGEIMVTAYRGKFYAECIVEADGTYSVIGEEDKTEFLTSSRIVRQHALTSIKNIAERTWNTSGSFIQSITIKGAGNLKASHSRHQQTMDAHPSSNVSVWMLRA